MALRNFVAQALQLPKAPTSGTLTLHSVVRRSMPGNPKALTSSVGVSASRAGTAPRRIQILEFTNREEALELIRGDDHKPMKVACVSDPDKGTVVAKFLVPAQTSEEAIWNKYCKSDVFKKPTGSDTPQARAYQSQGMRDPNVPQVPQGPKHGGSGLSGVLPQVMYPANPWWH